MAETRTARLIVLEQALHSSAVRRDPVATAALLSEEFREFGASSRVWSGQRSWRLESGQWRMLFHQGTPVPPQQT